MASSNIVQGPGSPVRPGTSFEVLGNQPLEGLRQPYAAAYGCVSPDRPEDSFFALVSDPALPPRHELTEKLAALQLNDLMTPLAWGPVTVPGAPPHAHATVFERPSGDRVVVNMTDTIKPFTADDVLRRVLPSFVAVLKAFTGMRITHRGIRPTNLFYRGSGKQLVFGEAVAAPPGAAQPIFCETIESAMTQPHCRGAGTPADDLYALGATIVFLVLGRDPTAQFAPAQLLRQKIERGSFMTVTAAQRLPPELIELLRGLLNDDVRERWTIDDVDNWALGRRLKPRQTSPSGITATRPFEFNGQGYYTARGIAHAFAGDPAAAARAIRSTDFEIWLQRSLADEKRSVAVNQVRGEPGETRGSLAQDLRLTARTCIALDPEAPIRYGDFTTAVDGIGYALAAAFQGRGALQTIGEVLLGRLPQSWMAAQANLRPEILALNVAKPFDLLRRYAEDPRPGYGLERVLYELNPRLPCLSPALAAEGVADVANLLRALESAAARGQVADVLVDRHVVAFAAARSREVSRDCYDLLSGTPRQRTLGMLSIFAHLQAAYGPAAVPALGKLVSAQATQLVDMFHSKQRRARIQAEVAKLSSKGSLGDLFWLLHSSAENNNDAQGFAAARREHAAIMTTLATLQREERLRPSHAIQLAGHASVIAGTIVAVGIGLVAALQVW